MKMELIEGSETSAISIVTPGNYPKENILHTGHGESLKSRKISTVHALRTDFFKMRLSKRWARGLLEQYATSKLEDQLLSLSTTVNSVYSPLPIMHGGRPRHP